MIIQRISKGIKEQDWFVVAVEVMIVVVGIFIGLQVDDWNEVRKEKALSKVFQQNLLTDLRNDIPTLQSRIDYLSAEITFGEQALFLLENNRENIENPVNAVRMFYEAGNRWNYISNQPTFDELQSSGRLDLVGDRDLRNSLITLYDRRKNALQLGNYTRSYRTVIRGLIPANIGSEIIENCQVFRENEAGLLIGHMEMDCTISLDQNRASEILTKIIQYPDIGIILNFQLSALRTYRWSLENLFRATENRILLMEGVIKENKQ